MDNSLYRFICKCLRERLSCVSMDKYIQVFTRKINSISQWINLYKYSRERLILCIDLCKCLREGLSCVSMDKSIQVFTIKINSISQWINLYKSSRERLILCIDLYVSVYARDYPAFQWINLYKYSRERLILYLNG